MLRMKKFILPSIFVAASLISSITCVAQSLCNDFGTNGLAATLESHITRFNSAVVLANGKIVAVGYYDNNHDKDFLVARYNANGTPDATFGKNGVRTYDLTGNEKDDIAMCVTVALDGNVLIGGVSDGYGSIIKISTGGALVNSFGTAGKVTYPILYSSVESILIGNGNTIYGVGKTLDTENIAVRRLGIRAFSQNGAPVTEFGDNGHYYNFDFLLWQTDQIDAALQSDGKLLVSASFGAPDNIDLWKVIRVNSNGTIDTSFGTDGIMEEGEPAKAKVEDIKLGADGAIYLGGVTGFDSALPSLGVVKKRNSNGTPATAFNGNGSATHTGAGDNAVISAIEVDDSGRVYVAGSKRNASDETDFLFAAFNANGSADAGFGVHVDRIAGSNGGALTDLIRLSNGSFIACGYINAPDHEYGVVVRYKATGELDDAFGSGGTSIARYAGEGSLMAMARTSDGKIVTAGTYLHNGSNTGVAVARFNADGSPDLSFGTYGYVRYDISDRRQFVRAIHVYENGKILVGGNVLNAGSGEDYLLVKLNADGSLDNTFGTNGVFTKHHGAYGKRNTLNNFHVDSEGRILIAGDANYLGGSYNDATLMRLLPNTTNDASFGDNGVVRVTLTVVNDSFSDVAMMDDGSFLAIGSGTVNVGGVVVKISSAGVVDETFGTNGVFTLPWADEDEEIRAEYVISNSNNKLLLGAFKKEKTKTGSTPVLCRINTAGSVDNSFDGDGYKILSVFDDTSQPGWLVDGEQIVVAGENETSAGDFSMMILDNDGDELDMHHFTVGEDGIVQLIKNPSGGYYAGLSTSNGLGLVVCLNPEGSQSNPGDCDDIDVPEISTNDEMLIATSADSYQWYKDSEVIPGETGQTLTIDLLDAAIYQVRVTIGNCVLYSDEYVHVITAISPEKARSISVYPNPVQGDIVIQSATDLRNVNLELYSPQGALIDASNASQGFTATISGEGLKPGVYYLRAKSSHGTEIIRILKTR